MIRCNLITSVFEQQSCFNGKNLKMHSFCQKKFMSNFIAKTFMRTNTTLRLTVPFFYDFRFCETFGDEKQHPIKVVRHAHTDIKVPNFDKYRRKSVSNPEKASSDSVDMRRITSYLPTTLGIVGAVYAGKTALVKTIMVMSPSAEVLASAQIEVKISDIAVGTSFTVKWRGKPVFIRHRTAEQIEKERKVPLSSLRDPATDEQMANKKPEWLVVIGVCTHLGCVPIADAGDYGGYYCPCHGSHYDYAGRIRRGPAPLNLEIPPYEFLDDKTLVIG